MGEIRDAAPEDFKSALKKKWAGAPAALDYYDWAKDSSYPVFGDWEPKSNKKKVASCEQPQVKENISSFSSMMNLIEDDAIERRELFKRRKSSEAAPENEPEPEMIDGEGKNIEDEFDVRPREKRMKDYCRK